MDERIYRQMYEMEERHWWFVSRRMIVEALLQPFADRLGAGARILDAGCGTGGNLRLLAQLGPDVVGMEPEPAAAEMARRRTGLPVFPGRLPDDIPFPEEYFDLILLLDVLEHVDDDTGAVRALALRLKPGGHLLLTVPAYGFLWSAHDEVHHHRRRYVLREIVGQLRNSGLTVKRASYFNCLLFPPIALLRLLKSRIKGWRNRDDLAMPPSALNRTLATVMSSERYLLKYCNLPFGVSIIALAQKTPGEAAVASPEYQPGESDHPQWRRQKRRGCRGHLLFTTDG